MGIHTLCMYRAKEYPCFIKWIKKHTHIIYVTTFFSVLLSFCYLFYCSSVSYHHCVEKCIYVVICVLCHFRFSPVKELAPVGTPVGTILAAAINQTIFYSIVSGNELGMSYTSCTMQSTNLKWIFTPAIAQEVVFS